MAFQFSQTGQELQYLADEVTQLAGAYDETASYAIGDYCNYQGTVYRCTAATTGIFDAADWTSSVIVMDAIKSLKARMTTAEGNISTAQGDITTLNQSLAQSYTVKTATNPYGTMTNRYVKIGKLIIGQIDVLPNQAINTSIGNFSDIADYHPAANTTIGIHTTQGSEQKVQYVIARTDGVWTAHGPYTANWTSSGVYCYMTT